MIVIAGTMRVRTDRRDEATAAMQRVVTATHEEPGNRAYRYSWDLDDPGVVHVFEEWESPDALDAHFQTPHIAEFGAALGELVDGEVSFQRYEVTEAGPLFS